MTQSTLLVLVIGIVVLLVVIGLIAAFTTRRGPRLRSLPDESRDRFARSWTAIEARFIEDPRGAVQEADKTAVMILSERGATLEDERKVPREMRTARQEAGSDQGRDGTEGLRRAMVHYKKIVEDAVGAQRMGPREREGRREVAS
jgi:hypothetical protein